MKTTRIMKRELLGYQVRQNHKTGMLCANDLHIAGNSSRETKKQMGSYFALNTTKELIKELCFLNSVDESGVKLTTRGNKGATWLCPELFVDMAMWYSPPLRARVLKWVVDALLESRDNSGESYKAMNTALTLNFPSEFNDPRTYSRVALSISAACKVGLANDKWETATTEQLKQRENIHRTIVSIAEFCSSVNDCVSRAINKQINK